MLLEAIPQELHSYVVYHMLTGSLGFRKLIDPKKQ